MYFKTQKFLIAGASASGVSAAKLLLRHGAEVFVYDESDGAAVKRNCENLKDMGAHIVSRESLSSAEEKTDVLVLSPGVPIDHPLAVRFRKAGKKIIGEMELGVRLLKSPVIAVTGTNGKTTTVSMLGTVFREAGINAVTCGNIGKPICDVAEELTYDDIAIAEVSSFQLESLSSLECHVAVELNITEDHLNRHYNMENYIFLKNKLLKNSTESEYVVLNRDDKIVRGFAEKTKARVVWFSLTEKVDGAYYEEGDLYWRGEKVISGRELPVSGTHNIANALACICAAALCGIPTEEIAKGLKSFKGIRHRIEKIGELNGVQYVNDSKATNVDATIKALDGMSGEVILLAGGKDKGYDYDFLFRKIKEKNVASVIVYGENRLKLLASATKCEYENVTVCPFFDTAVLFSFVTAKKGQTVLLSPASSSFDAFSGYEERGERFAMLVREMQETELIRERMRNDEKETDKEFFPDSEEEG